MATDPLGQRFATGGSVDGYVYLWSIDALEPLLLIPGATEGCTVESLAFIPQSPYLACAGVDWRSSGQEGKLCLWNLDRSAKVNSTQTGGLALAANPIGTQLALATLVESICLFQLPDLTLERELLGHCGLVTALSYLADGSLLSAGEDGTLRTWEHKTGKELQVIETQVPIRDFAVSPDGRYAYLANANATISVIDLKQGK
jgi:WD40 repeat protein